MQRTDEAGRVRRDDCCSTGAIHDKLNKKNHLLVINDRHCLTSEFAFTLTDCKGGVDG
jgi:hypothetical protein